MLAADGMTIRRARLRTADGVADDVWDVELPGGGAPDPERIRRALDRREPPRRRAAPRRGHAPAGPPARAFVVPGGSWDATVLEVRADDRVGLLADLGLPDAVMSIIVGDTDLYADEQLGMIAARLGFADELGKVLDSLGH